MLPEDNIRIMLFTVLCICFIFYLFMGIYSYRKDNKSKGNLIFFTLCISTSLWPLGYAFMLISPNLEIANIWRIVSAIGWCYFISIMVSFALSFKDTNQENSKSKLQYLLYVASTIFFASNLIYEPSKVVSREAYGFVDNLYTSTTIGAVFSIYITVFFIVSLIIIYLHIRNSEKNRVRKQMKTILFTSLVSFCLAVISDLIFPRLGIMCFPIGGLAFSVGMGGMWLAINKHEIMSISPKFASEYIFESVNEPIFILDEGFFIKNCNEASLNMTGYNYMDLDRAALDTIINLRDFNLIQ
jgi:hypothetical protein